VMLKRYEPDGDESAHMREDEKGEYVELADVQALFTWEDVAEIRAMVPYPAGHDLFSDDDARLLALADRIESLLKEQT
jgi:hypothetical protein